MPLLVFVLLFLITNWFFYQIFGLIPVNFGLWSGKFTGIILFVIIAAFLSWCFGD
jgi:hypothetical protein